MKLYMMRHGETSWNKIRRIQGQSDIDLNEAGREAARLTSKALKDFRFDAAYTSPLSRARETGEIVLAGRDIPLIEDERLKEANFGPYEGADLNELYEKKEPILDFFDRPHKMTLIEGAETPAQVVERSKIFLEEFILPMEKEAESVILFTHGAFIHGMLTNMYKRDVRDFWKGPKLKNCSISTAEVKDGCFCVLSEAEVLY